MIKEINDKNNTNSIKKKELIQAQNNTLNNINSDSKKIYKEDFNNKDDYLKKKQEKLNNKIDKEIQFNNATIKPDNFGIIIPNDSHEIHFNQLKQNYKYGNKPKYDIIQKKDTIFHLEEENSKIKSEDVYSRDTVDVGEEFLKDKKMENIEAINYPLNLIKDDNSLFSISKKDKIVENKINKDFDEKKENKKIIINPIISNEIDVKEKLLEINEKVERSANNIKIIKHTNEKLLEIIKNFQNFKNIIKSLSTKQNSPKNIFSKRRCSSPSINNINISKK